MTHLYQLIGLLLACCAATFTFQPIAWSAADQVQIILDASGSMKESLGGKPKIEIARETLKEVIQQTPATSQIGLRAFGHNLAHTDPKTCTDSELLIPIGSGDRQALLTKVGAITVRGETPIAYSLEKAGADFGPDTKKTVVLLSDGKETCNGDPVAVLAKLKQRGIELKVHVIGFAVDAETTKQLQAIAQASGGNYFEAKDAAQLKLSVQKAVAVAPAPAPAPAQAEPEPELVNLIAPAHGGQIQTASHDKFAQLTDGKENHVYWFYPEQEAVYSFKDGQMATLHKVAMPIYATRDDNIASFDIYASSTSPLEGFTKVGTYKPRNIKMFQSVFQEFAINPPVQAKYVKLVIGLNAKGGKGSQLYEFRVLGKLGAPGTTAPAPTPAAPAQPTAELINLLAADQGGQIITASHDKFAQLIDGKESNVYWFYSAQEAVYGFNGGKKAMVHRVAVPIFATRDDNMASFDIFVSEDSPTDGFTKVGTFSPKNIKMFNQVYQEFALPQPVKAKYVKFVVGPNAKGGKGSQLYEFRVLVTLE